MDKHEALRRWFGYDSFRPGQEGVIDALISGKDVLAVMPTGAGKSLCYQIPALVRPGMTIVVSPLIALMCDQVRALAAAGVPCGYINGTLTSRQIALAMSRAAQGMYKLLYVAPERLLGAEFLRLARSVEIGMVIVDEAHCISMWGGSFRPSYQRIGEFVGQLPRRPVLGAFTATATAAVARDIESMLGLVDPMRVTTGFDRPNLYFDVREPVDKLAELHDLLERRRGMCGVVYCMTRRTVEDVCEAVRRMGIDCARYHAGLTAEERARAQSDFLSGAAQVIVATNAFGMGIDKPDVRYVIHYNMPLDLEGYYQEAGRAGRDGQPADCILLFGEEDMSMGRWLIGSSESGEGLTEEQNRQHRARALAKLERMEQYCRTHSCLRADILEYFGQRAECECGQCSNCIKFSILSKLRSSGLARLIGGKRTEDD